MAAECSGIELLLSLNELIWMSARYGERKVAASDQVVDLRVEVVVAQLIDSGTDPLGKQIARSVRLVRQRIVTQHDVGLAKRQRLAYDITEAWSRNGIVE